MKQQKGFGAIAAIVVLVILAVLAAAIVSIGAGQAIGSAQDVMSARAWQAARAGNEWGLYQALKGTWTTCSSASPKQTLVPEIGFRVTVSCDSKAYYEGDCDPIDPSPYCVVHPTDPLKKVKQIRVYTVSATACNSSTACPDNAMAASMGYVERTRVVVATN